MKDATIIADASALIYLAKSESFAEAHSVLGVLGIPPAVWQEAVERGEAGRKADAAVTRHALGQALLVMLHLTPRQERAAWALGREHRLGVGESQAIVLARGVATVLMDDERGKSVAQSLGIPVVPTNLLPLLGVRRRILDRAQALDLLIRISGAMRISSDRYLEVRMWIEEE